MKISLIATSFILLSACMPKQESIDRKSLVTRHNIKFLSADSANIPQVGNGEIAFGIDVTGLQTLYGNTMSQWAWHTDPFPSGKTLSDFKMTGVPVHGRTVTYPVTRTGQEEIYDWLRENPHRFNLGKLSFLLDGKPVSTGTITEINQLLDIWSGVIYSTYRLKGELVQVITTCHPDFDVLAVKVQSPLILEKRLSIQIAFSYGSSGIFGADWSAGDKHETTCTISGNKAVFHRRLDNDSYEARITWFQSSAIEETKKHFYSLIPQGESSTLSFTCHFVKDDGAHLNQNFEQALEMANTHWEQFWTSGGAIDLSESKDSRWNELERRIVLSQYLLAVNEAGSLPPQESGLLLNSGWYGKFHLEMHWWHGAHYELWDRWELFDRSLSWYPEIMGEAQKIAERQGYEGARWPKMIGPDGRFGPSKIGPWLIWQQPHPIFYAEQNYRIDSSEEVLEKWKDIVFETADFMASYAFFNSEKDEYELGPYVINAAENNRGTLRETINPAFELAYWRYGLKTASRWRERMGLPVNKKWLDVENKLAQAPVEDGVYLMYENVPDMWTKFNNSHIDIIGTGAFIPNEFVDLDVLNKTIDKVWNEWDMESTWGWDFPWLAMAAARTGQPEKAVDALLMESSKNTYNKCGINGGGPADTYFPGNGGLLYAVAMMAAGWDGAPDKHAPGFPDDDSWLVKFEGLRKAQ